MDIEHEIDVTIASLLAGEVDSREVLREFASKVQESASPVISQCPSCGEREALCFRCKTTELVGEQAMENAPRTILAMTSLVNKWWSERKNKPTEAQDLAPEGDGPVHWSPPDQKETF